MNYQNFKKELSANINAGDDGLLKFIDRTISDNSGKEVSFRKATFSALKDINPTLALKAIEPVIHLIDDAKFIEAIRSRSLKLIGEWDELARPIYKKAILKSIEIKFDEDITYSNIDVAISEVDIMIDKYPYLAKTLYRRIKNKYLKSNSRVSEIMSSKLTNLTKS